MTRRESTPAASDRALRGHCLCGAVEFELRGRLPRLYQCHCSLCRRVSGSSANAALIVDREQLVWRKGADSIRRYATASGWQSHFCGVCGSPLPNSSREGEAWWVPVGLLEDAPGLELGAHLYVGSKARWDRIADAGAHFDEMPDRAELDRLLRGE